MKGSENYMETIKNIFITLIETAKLYINPLVVPFTIISISGFVILKKRHN